MPPAPIQSNTSGQSAIGALLSRGGGSPAQQGPDDVRAQIEALASQIRDLGAQVDAIAADMPMAAPEVTQIKTLLKQIIVKAAQQAPQATASGSAVPTGATMGAPAQ